MGYGPLAQVVEQLAFNQRVAGSSPARLTLQINCGQPLCCPFLFVYLQCASLAKEHSFELVGSRLLHRG